MSITVFNFVYGVKHITQQGEERSELWLIIELWLIRNVGRVALDATTKMRSFRLPHSEIDFRRPTDTLTHTHSSKMHYKLLFCHIHIITSIYVESTFLCSIPHTNSSVWMDEVTRTEWKLPYEPMRNTSYSGLIRKFNYIYTYCIKSYAAHFQNGTSQ